jgi:hypothetical protein
MAAADDKLTSLRTHSEYYIRGGDLHFIVSTLKDIYLLNLSSSQVENYRFRVHSFFFERESVYFQERLKASPSVKNLPDGSSDSNAIQLDDVKSVAFERLLWVFYNPYVYEHSTLHSLTSNTRPQDILTVHGDRKRMVNDPGAGP